MFEKLFFADRLEMLRPLVGFVKSQLQCHLDNCVSINLRRLKTIVAKRVEINSSDLYQCALQKVLLKEAQLVRAHYLKFLRTFCPLPPFVFQSSFLLI